VVAKPPADFGTPSAFPFARQVDSKNAIPIFRLCLRWIVIKWDFDGALEGPVVELFNKILASLSAAAVRSFAPNCDSICIDCEFQVFFLDRSQFKFDNQVPLFRNVNVGIGAPPVLVLWMGQCNSNHNSKLLVCLDV